MNVAAIRASNTSDGGSWTRSAPRRASSRPAAARKSSSAGPQCCRRASWVIVRGSLTENRKSGGTLAAQRAYVVGRCGRWNEELISTQLNTVA